VDDQQSQPSEGDKVGFAEYENIEKALEQCQQVQNTMLGL
jgi:hypothetical protein